MSRARQATHLGALVVLAGLPGCALWISSADLCSDAVDRTWYYRDADGDGLGDPAITVCTLPRDGRAYVTNADDCDDAGYSTGLWYLDGDGDGLGDPSTGWCAEPGDGRSYVPNNSDCDDTDADVGEWSFPVGADVVYVDETGGSPGDGSQSAPLTSIQAAADLAGARGGGTVFVAPGRYVGNIVLGRDHDGVSIVGACRAATTLVGEEGTDSWVVYLDGPNGTLPSVSLDGLTISGGEGGGILVSHARLAASATDVVDNADYGVAAIDNAEVSLLGVRIEGTTSRDDDARGVVVESGSQLSATDCVVRDNEGFGVIALEPDTSLELWDTEISANQGGAIWAQDGAMVVAGRLFMTANSGGGAVAIGEGALVVLEQTTIADTQSGEWGSSALAAVDGAQLTANSCLIEGNTAVGIFGSGPGSALDLTDVIVEGTQRPPDAAVGLGVWAEDGAAIALSTTTVQDTEGPGVFIATGASVDLSATQLLDNQLAGAVVWDGTLRIADGSTITGTVADPEAGGGMGVLASAFQGAPSLALLDSTIGPHPYAAVWLDGPGAYYLDGNHLQGGSGFDLAGFPVHGNAVFAERGVLPWDGSSGLLLSGNSFLDAELTAVLLDGSSAVLRDNTWANPGTDVVQQRCEGVPLLTSEDLAGVSTWELCPDALYLIDAAFTFESF